MDISTLWVAVFLCAEVVPMPKKPWKEPIWTIPIGTTCWVRRPGKAWREYVTQRDIATSVRLLDGDQAQYSFQGWDIRVPLAEAVEGRKTRGDRKRLRSALQWLRIDNKARGGDRSTLCALIRDLFAALGHRKVRQLVKQLRRLPNPTEHLRAQAGAA